MHDEMVKQGPESRLPEKKTTTARERKEKAEEKKT
jgi:hypothetical protein